MTAHKAPPAPGIDFIRAVAAAMRDEAEAKVRRAWKPMSQSLSNVTRLEKARRRARLLASEFGHKLGDWENDTDESSVAECLVCEELAAVDATHMQPVEVTGFATKRPCAGPRIY